MTRTVLVRLLLAAVLAIATCVHDVNAQRGKDPPPPDPPPAPAPPPDPPPAPAPTPDPIPNTTPGGSHSNRNVVWYIVGGVALAVIGLVIGKRFFPGPEPRDQFSPPLPPQDPSPVAVLTPDPPPLPTRLAKGGQPKSGPITRNGFNLPPIGETRFVANEVMLDIPSNVPTRTLDIIAARHAMTRLETKTFHLTGRTLHRWRLDGGGGVPDMIRGLAGERQVAGAQPVYLFEMAQDALPQMNADQYAPDKLNLPEAHRLATGSRVLVAVIDSGVDAAHPDLAGAVAGNFDAVADDSAPHPHGTGMAGAIAARRTVLGSAPRVGLLTIRAFSPMANNAEATTFNIIKGLDWAAERGARIVNMSFAGPSDPRLRDALAKAFKKGMILIAAAGNAGPNSPPLYPAADPNVIAVTATDINDKLYSGANRGNHIAVAAPGVEILVPAPAATYQFTTGTSVAAAEVSGVAALLLERNPSLTPADVRRILMRTAKSVAPKGREREFGAGLVDAYQAVESAGSKPADKRAAR